MFKPLAVLSPAVLVLASCGGTADAPPGEPPLAGSTIGGPFTLVDAQGDEVKWSDFEGRYRIVYFGYTWCPDVCPLDMQRLAKGYALFKANEPAMAAQVQPIFISVDPERDTPDKVGEFTHAFSDDFIGLTGTTEQVDAAAKAFAVWHEQAEPNETGAYLVNHSNLAYLMGREGEPIATLPVDIADRGEAIAAELARWTN